MDLTVQRRLRGTRYGMNRKLFLDLVVNERLLLSATATQIATKASTLCWNLDQCDRLAHQERPYWASTMRALDIDEIEAGLYEELGLNVLSGSVLAGELYCACVSVETLMLDAVKEIDRGLIDDTGFPMMEALIRQAETLWPRELVFREWRGEFDPASSARVQRS